MEGSCYRIAWRGFCVTTRQPWNVGVRGERVVAFRAWSVPRVSPAPGSLHARTCDWMLASVARTGYMHAAVQLRPGSRGTPGSTVSGEPGSREPAISLLTILLVHN
jgi:hypothetical protein